MMNDDLVNVDNDADTGSLSLNEDPFESDENDNEISSDDDVFIQTKPSCNDNQNCLSIDIQRTMASHKKCVVCYRKDSSTKLRKLNDEAILDAYLKTNIFIPFNCRVCSYHFDEHNYLNDESINNLKAYETRINMKKCQIKKVIGMLRYAAIHNSFFTKFNTLKTFDNKTCKDITGMLF